MSVKEPVRVKLGLLRSLKSDKLLSSEKTGCSKADLIHAHEEDDAENTLIKLRSTFFGLLSLFANYL